MLVIPWLMLSEQAPTLPAIRMLISIGGFILLCLGVVLYFCVLLRDRSSRGRPPG